MPTYVYEILAMDGNPTGETFEAFQSMKDDHLTKEPGTGRPCRRAIVVPNIGNKELRGKAQVLTDMGCKRHEVDTVRKLYGNDLGGCWQSDGTVKVQSARQAKRLYEREQQIMGKFAEQKAAGKLPTKAEKRAARAAKMAKAVRNN